MWTIVLEARFLSGFTRHFRVLIWGSFQNLRRIHNKNNGFLFN